MKREWVEWAIGVAVVFFLFELVTSANAGQSTPLLPSTSTAPTNSLNTGLLGLASYLPVSPTAFGLSTASSTGAQSLVNGTTTNPVSPNSIYGGDFGL